MDRASRWKSRSQDLAAVNALRPRAWRTGRCLVSQLLRDRMPVDFEWADVPGAGADGEARTVAIEAWHAWVVKPLLAGGWHWTRPSPEGASRVRLQPPRPRPASEGIARVLPAFKRDGRMLVTELIAQGAREFDACTVIDYRRDQEVSVIVLDDRWAVRVQSADRVALGAASSPLDVSATIQWEAALNPLAFRASANSPEAARRIIENFSGDIADVQRSLPSVGQAFAMASHRRTET
jgi:hypothetical protein